MTSAALDSLQAWVGRTEAVGDRIGATPVKALDATLDHPARPVVDGTPLPPLWHWLYFLPLHRQSEIGPDGHAKRGGFLPPVPLPRRMWAGSQFEFRAPVRVGDGCCRRDGQRLRGLGRDAHRHAGPSGGGRGDHRGHRSIHVRGAGADEHNEQRRRLR